MSAQIMIPQQISIDVLIEKYCKGGETTVDEVYARVATGIASIEKTPQLQAQWQVKYYENLQRGALGAGRIMSAAGTDIDATLNNCYVMPVGDSVQGTDGDGVPGIYESLRMAAETMRRGGGVGYNFSLIRPRNAFVKGTHSYSSGPCSYIDVFDWSGKTVESAGGRRGAQLAALNIDHPDIEEFITAKRTPGRWNSFNVSVFVSDAFMDAVKNNGTWQLVHKARPGEKLMKENTEIFQREDGLWVYETVDAVKLWDKIMRSNYEFAEPGILFGDNINKSNNLRYCETIKATNPCGEQPLPDFGCCDLGPINLARFVKNPFTETAQFEWDDFEQALRVQVRFLDGVLDATYWPLPEQKEESRLKRRIGVGFTALGNAMAMLNIVYYSDEGVDFAESIARRMAEVCYDASVDLAIEKGRFPLFEADKYLEEGTMASRLPEQLKARIREHGIRNSHLLSIAPTGTVSLAFADNASNGIEPPFSLAYERRKRIGSEEWTSYTVMDHGLRVFLSTMADQGLARAVEQAIAKGKTSFEHEGDSYIVADLLPKSLVTALSMAASDHMRVMAAVQKWVCTSISKTVNVPVDYPYENFKDLYMTAFELGCKGLSTYRPNSILGSVLSEIKEEPVKEVIKEQKVQEEVSQSNTLDAFYNSFIDKREEEDYPAINRKVSFMTADGKRSLYVSMAYKTATLSLQGVQCQISRPMEVFITSSQDNVPSEWVGINARQLSLLARAGMKAFVKGLENCREMSSDKGRIRYGWYIKADGVKVPRYHESEVACIGYVIQDMLFKIGVMDENGRMKSENAIVAEHNRQSLTVPSVVQGILQMAEEVSSQRSAIEDSQSSIIPGKKCEECGAHAVIKKDGCSHCTNCGNIGSCG